MYAISLYRLLGVFANGKMNTGGQFSFSKRLTLSDAKREVSEEFKNGYYNLAYIYDQETQKEICRFKGREWEEIPEDMVLRVNLEG